MWQGVARGNIQQMSYILQTEQHLPSGECNYYMYVSQSIYLSIKNEGEEETR